MKSSLDPGALRFLAGLAQLNSRIERAQSQLTSGRRINVVSDDPDEVSRLLLARADLSEVMQARQNLGRVKTEIDTSEQALTSATAVMERARVLATQGANGTQDAGTRRIISLEVQALLEQLVSLSGTETQGRLVFSGDNDATVPYTLDFNQPNPVSFYAGAPATREIQHPNGSRFNVSKTAEEIFDSPNPGANAFAAVHNLQVALENNDEPGIIAALTEVRTAADHVIAMHAYYGLVQTRVAEASAEAGRIELRLRTQIAGIEDADTTAAILEFNQARFEQEAALTAKANAPRTSLFDFLS